MHRISSQIVPFAVHTQGGTFSGRYFHGSVLIDIPLAPKRVAFGGDDCSSIGAERGRRYNVSEIVPLIFDSHGYDLEHEYQKFKQEQVNH